MSLICLKSFKKDLYIRIFSKSLWRTLKPFNLWRSYIFKDFHKDLEKILKSLYLAHFSKKDLQKKNLFLKTFQDLWTSTKYCYSWENDREHVEIY